MHPTQNPGTPVHVNFTKWDGREHWQSDGVLLGSDEYGVWVGFSADTEFYRPGRRVTAKRDPPCSSRGTRAGWVASTTAARRG